MLGDLAAWGRALILQHTALGIFGVLLVEELGIPLPIPGDLAISLGGYLSDRGRVSYAALYAAAVAGTVLGSTGLFSITRRVGPPFLLRFGRWARIDEAALARAERRFQRWGGWAILVGRLVPGMRITMTAVAGSFQVPYRVFLPAVTVSAAIWVGAFLELGRRLGPRTVSLFHLLPTDLVPWGLLLLLLLPTAYLAWRRRAA